MPAASKCGFYFILFYFLFFYVALEDIFLVCCASKITYADLVQSSILDSDFQIAQLFPVLLEIKSYLEKSAGLLGFNY